MKWSYSRLRQYKNCPKQFYETRVAGNFQTKDTTASIYGKALHEAIENFVISNAPFPKNYEKALNKIPLVLSLIPGLQYAETKMAIDADFNPCKFDDDNYWVRGIADLIAILGDHAAVVDWKSGSDRYADTKQLTLMALLIFANFPEVDTVSGMLFFIKNEHPVFSPDYKREDLNRLWESFSVDLQLLENSYQANNWPMTPSGLCGWCPVETCPHWRE